MKIPTERQISDAISMIKLCWSCGANPSSSSQIGQEMYAYLLSQEESILAAAGKGELTKAHLNLLMETPLISNSRLPSLLDSAIRDAGTNRVGLINQVSRFCKSDDLKVRINASFSMILISNQFPPLLRMFELQGLISKNLTEMQYRAIVDAATDALVDLCRETMDRDIAERTMFFFNEQSLLFSAQISQLRALPMRISMGPAQKPPWDGKRSGTPEKYPDVTRRPSFEGTPSPRKRMSTIRPRVPSCWSTIRVPKERY